MKLFNKHQELLVKAIEALHTREFFAAFPEHPSPKIYGEDADADGRMAFKELLGKKFEALEQEAPAGWIGEERSPYLDESLNITYPSFAVEELIGRAQRSAPEWRKAPPEERAGLLMESLERIKNRFFELAYATMHTTGQGYMMAFQASGPHAADRALEAIAAGYEEMKRFPGKARWDKPMGKYNIVLDKTWQAVPKGIGLVIGCSTFPTWNSLPGLYASLVTGNPVLVKPHPGAVLPMALVVAEIRRVFRENGLPADICQLAVDSADAPLALSLAENPKVRLIDFTGNSDFGNRLEQLAGKTVFTEKTGVNSVILHSAENVDKVAANLAFSVALYSGQMCTAPQNLFLPAAGIQTPDGPVDFDTFADKLVEQINGLADNPKAGPYVLGAIQNEKTCSRLDDARQSGAEVLLAPRTIENPQFPKARIRTPLVLAMDASDYEKFSREWFGPIVILIRTPAVEEAIAMAGSLAEKYGAISCGAYVTDPEVKQRIAETMALAGTPVSFNLTGGIYMNQNAGFSDFHVTGGNPAGNASITNPEFVIRRFTWVGHREPAPV